MRDEGQVNMWARAIGEVDGKGQDQRWSFGECQVMCAYKFQSSHGACDPNPYPTATCKSHHQAEPWRQARDHACGVVGPTMDDIGHSCGMQAQGWKRASRAETGRCEAAFQRGGKRWTMGPGPSNCDTDGPRASSLPWKARRRARGRGARSDKAHHATDTAHVVAIV